MKSWACFFIIVGIISVVLGLVVKFLWYTGILTFLPFGIDKLSYIVFANSMFLLAIAISMIGLLKQKV